MFCSLKQSEKKYIYIYNPPTQPNFSQNWDENLKIYLVWSKGVFFYFTQMTFELLLVYRFDTCEIHVRQSPQN